MRILAIATLTFDPQTPSTTRQTLTSAKPVSHRLTVLNPFKIRQRRFKNP